MKKKSNNTRNDRQLSAQQLGAAGGGYWGCDIFGGFAGVATHSAMSAYPLTAPFAGYGGVAAAVGGTNACNYVVDNWDSFGW